MKTRIFKMICVLALSVPIGAKAQNTIQGKVINQEGQAIAGAKITIQNTYQTSFTNSEGLYKISHLKNGSYKLEADFSGYETQFKTIEVGGQDAEVNFQLTLSAELIEEVQVSATRANEKTPTSYSNLSKKEIERANFGQDLPYLLESTPSTVVSSDAGAGVGYTGVRIRGVDPTRTNVTINGIPVNDGESHNVFWVNMPDFASSTESIQVQRGVGTSSNGAAAFGASLNIKTDQVVRKAYAESDNAYGSFNTLRTSVKAGTGLINNKFTVDTRLSRITSDGYIDRANSNLKSFYLSGAWIGKKSLLRLNVFSGKQTSYQAWNGAPESRIKNDVDGMNAYADRNYLSQEDRDNLLNSGRTYNSFTYKNQTDNYQQDHYQLHFTHRFTNKLNMNISGHYTKGSGYYEEYKTDAKFSAYSLTPVVIGLDTITRTDLIRQKWLDNHFYGTVLSLNYNNLRNLQVTWGGGINQYVGDHFGEIIWARLASSSEIGDRYYENTSNKLDANTYFKATYAIKKLKLYADMQVRTIQYSFMGVQEENGVQIDMQQNVNYTFFNPKAGLMYDFNEKNNVYASGSVANREPIRKDFIENTAANRPKAEELYNLEAGYKRKSSRFFATANYFMMYYKNQLILTGQINDVGGYTRTNTPESYRTGIELEAGYRILKNLSLTGNVTLSQNKIKEFKEYIDDYDNGGQLEVLHQNTDLAFTPNLIATLGLNYEPVSDLNFNILTKYVGNQFMDNTSSDRKMLNAYFLTNLSIDYTLRNVFFKEVQFGLLVNNVFNYMFENNGYTYSYIAGGETIHENFYFPQAGVNFLGRVTFKL